MARLMAWLIASSKPCYEVALNSVTRAIGINAPLFRFPRRFRYCFDNIPRHKNFKEGEVRLYSPSYREEFFSETQVPLLVVVKQIKSVDMSKKATMVNHLVERKKC